MGVLGYIFYGIVISTSNLMASLQVSVDDDDIEIQPLILVCVSARESYFLWTLYIIQGSLLAFGVFLAWETRKVCQTSIAGK